MNNSSSYPHRRISAEKTFSSKPTITGWRLRFHAGSGMHWSIHAWSSLLSPAAFSYRLDTKEKSLVFLALSLWVTQNACSRTPQARR